MSAEFASAAMLRVLTRGLQELGLPPMGEHAFSARNGSATVDLDLKRAVVQHALAHGGIGCLVHLGRGVHHHTNEPTHRAMMGARDPMELVVRWQRLERYIHSRHRLRIAAQGDRWMELTHDGVGAGLFPSVYESLVVFGVIAALLQARGVRGLVIRAGESTVFPDVPAAALTRLPTTDPSRRWRVSWDDCTGPWTSARPVGTAADPYPCSDWPPWQQRLVSHVLERLIDIPTATDAARALGVSLRTLQRGLRQRDLSFSMLVGDCRARVAALHLIESDLPLAEVGFLCGYCDQAHFTREFGKRVGMPPRKYRMAFRVR